MSGHDDDSQARLRRWALGTLSPSEERALLEDAESDPTLKAHLALYRPYSSRETERFERQADDAFAPDRGTDGVSRVVGQAGVARVRSRRSAYMWWAPAAAAVATAAAVAVATWAPSAKPLAPYTLTVEGGAAKALRDAEAPAVETERWSWDASVTLLVRPEVPIERPVELNVFVKPAHTQQDEPWRRVAVEAPAAPNGTFEFHSSTKQLFSAPGRYQLCLVVARPGQMIDPAHPTDPTDPTRQTELQVICRRIEVAAEDLP